MKKLFSLGALCALFFATTLSYGQQATSVINQQTKDCYHGDLDVCKQIFLESVENNTSCYRCAWPSVCYMYEKNIRSVHITHNKSDLAHIIVHHGLGSDTLDIAFDFRIPVGYEIDIKRAVHINNKIHVHFIAWYYYKRLDDSLIKKKFLNVRSVYDRQCFGNFAPEWEFDNGLYEYLLIQTHQGANVQR
ncbi:MAG: hypothetical protein LRY41_01600 [Candidatus Pacebacteria bacterium]|nr:hypothetical protein [Candidatus Paceibacterota bacterium]MCD8563911.1 hypothetical protein [Candidatus Paceibacterota bacterium]